ncbi:hypothetical protein QM787_22170 [Rhodococcus ruber]|uniref:Uncharacterized protein n=1 Tax=Rhodococcus ruber TaxID=1830 RepID=A0A098BPD0_9NOCA|nr:hypothetical protein [Rhodococcus ruber]ETT25785.1 hypothetical protein RR21198_3530 [Rhodococcus rhodochrous ATCC 21198]MCD2129556.1 hypothetical protein [Rhodococcus ruber]MCZ4505399.1 hypothetical protein [Rhodococcus ruber]MCZ4533507.1 hypothetical protein [Rhodococcus ruber]MCZ4623031.1 hypothetical protein [Rhodococcus ruber]
MTPPAESGGARERAAMTERLTTEFADRIAAHRALLRRLLGTDAPSRPGPAPHDARPLEGPSLTTPHLRIHVGHSYQDADELGSFPPGLEPVCVRIHVQGHCDRYPDLRFPRFSGDLSTWLR